MAVRVGSIVCAVDSFLLYLPPVRYTVASPPSLRFFADRSRAQAYLAPDLLDRAFILRNFSEARLVLGRNLRINPRSLSSDPGADLGHEKATQA
jgi:hypothetical protein